MKRKAVSFTEPRLMKPEEWRGLPEDLPVGWFIVFANTGVSFVFETAAEALRQAKLYYKVK
jgi:hypothetical protein